MTKATTASGMNTLSNNVQETAMAHNYGIDLFRMIAMYLICMHHVILHSGLITSETSLSARYLVTSFLYAFTFCAVNGFALVSGYVGINAHFKYRNLFRLWIQVFFYSASIMLIFTLTKLSAVPIENPIYYLFPMSRETYWYFTSYAIMFFCIPQMNHSLKTMAQKESQTLIWCMFVLFAIGSIVPIVRNVSIYVNRGYSAIWLAYLYFIGGYIKLYGVQALLPSHARVASVMQCLVKLFPKQLMLCSLFFMCIIGSFMFREGGAAFLASRGKDNSALPDPYTYLCPTMLLAAVALMAFCSHLQLKRIDSLIRWATPLTFGVYLIHDHPIVRVNLMPRFFEFLTAQPLYMFPLALLIIPLLIFICASLIDYLRLRLFQLLQTRRPS